jgi:hypothetical protein
MEDVRISYPWHPVTKQVRHVMSFAFLLASVWMALHAHTTILVVLAIVFGMAAVAAQLDQSTTIDRGTGQVSRDLSLWGILMRRSNWPLRDFSGSGVYRLPAGSPQAPTDLVHVGLQRADGSIVAFRYFSVPKNQPCPAAEDFEKELAMAFGNHGVA